MRVMKVLARLVGIDELAVDRTQNSAVGEVKQGDHDRRKQTKLEAEETGAGERREDKHDNQRSHGGKHNAAQPRRPEQIIMHEAKRAAPEQRADKEMKQQSADRRADADR